jgi:hypothetical protein
VTSSADPIRTILRKLSTAESSFLVYKHLAEGLSGRGDLDCFVAADRLQAVTDLVIRLASLHLPSLMGVISCDHTPGVRSIFLATEEQWPLLIQIDLITSLSRAGMMWGESPLSDQPSMVVEGGIRTLRPSAEALSLVMCYGLHPTGRSRITIDDRDRIASCLEKDSATISLTATSLAPRISRSLRLLAGSLVLEGSWSRALASRVWWHALFSSFRDLPFLYGRIVHRISRLRSGPCYLDVIQFEQSRQVEVCLDSFLTRAGESDHDCFVPN